MWLKYFLFDEADAGDGGGESSGGGLGFLDKTFEAEGAAILDADASNDKGTSSNESDKQASDGDADKGQVSDKKVERKPVPKSWKAEWHAHWDTVPDPLRDIIHTREEDFLKGARGYEEDRKFAKALRDAVAPYQQLIKSQGVEDPLQVVQYMLGAHGQLSNPDPKTRLDYFMKLANIYNIDPPSLAAALQSVQDGVKPDPAVQTLTQEVNTLKSRLGLEDQRRQQELERAIDDEVTAFAKDPKNVHFEELRADIAALLRGSETMTLAEAYERAVWGNPVTREKENSRILKEREETLRKEAEEKAAAKRKARGTNVRGQDADKGPTDLVGSIEDTMRETYRNIHSRTE